jgi:hypothetical protein
MCSGSKVAKGLKVLVSFAWQSLAFHGHLPEKRAYRKVATAFTGPRLPTRAAVLLLCHVAAGLMFDHDPLELPQDGFAFCHAQARRLQREVAPGKHGDLAHFLLPIFGSHYDLDLE